ncbi:hypothetical protein LOK46_30320 (plasmid) [Methylobacterium sp. NMS14P]|uniref:hypothetical protein n=1 Tax=Methylobacterium sp. NMS14P TaxID=2894310 RepID=UPI00235A0981|nr:hypothetical protein [Methylobacterium sp. NMS14P]WCS28688.1 hypothetical protein LOK46_30320 [Methylobacterium sp. NMS14P]
MRTSIPLPASVGTVVTDFMRRLYAERAPVLRGLYLVGSIAHDDVRLGASDIDFAAVLDRAPAEQDCTTLGRIHAGPL